MTTTTTTEPGADGRIGETQLPSEPLPSAYEGTARGQASPAPAFGLGGPLKRSPP